MSWSPPPRPCDVVPSFVLSKPRATLIQGLLYDFRHDADLKAAILTGPALANAPDGSNWLIDGSGAPTGAQVVRAILDPRVFAAENSEDPAALEALASSAKVQNAIAAAWRRRESLGPLPANSYADPVVVYYYDTDKIKRVEYPRNVITLSPGMALDPNNHEWWKAPGVHTYEQHADGSWGDEGFDFNKDIAGTLTAAASAILAVIGVVLAATGVGAAAGAALLAWSAALLAVSEALVLGLNGKDTSQAIEAMIDACTKFVGVELPPGTLSQIGKPALAALGAVLSQLLPIAKATHGQSFAVVAAQLEAAVGTMGPVTDATEAHLSALLGGAAGAVLDAGYGAVDYVDAEEIDGIEGVLPDPDQQTLFRLGALLGWARKSQTHAVRGVPIRPLPKGATVPRASPQAVNVHALAAAQLETYVRTTLFPRYHLT